MRNILILTLPPARTAGVAKVTRNSVGRSLQLSSSATSVVSPQPPHPPQRGRIITGGGGGIEESGAVTSYSGRAEGTGQEEGLHLLRDLRPDTVFRARFQSRACRSKDEGAFEHGQSVSPIGRIFFLKKNHRDRRFLRIERPARGSLPVADTSRQICYWVHPLC